MDFPMSGQKIGSPEIEQVKRSKTPQVGEHREETVKDKDR